MTAPTLLPHTRASLTRSILRDLTAGPSTASHLTQRLGIDGTITDHLCEQLVSSAHLTSHTIKDVLTVYRLTTKGSQALSE